MRLSTILAALLLSVCVLGARAAESEREWFRLRLGEESIGHVWRERRVEGGTVTHHEHFEARFRRNGEPLDFRSDEIHRETLDARPLGFRMEQQTGSHALTIDGEVVAGRIHLRTRDGGRAQSRWVDWPQGALMSEGLEQATAALAPVDGASAKVQLFLVTSQTAAEATVTRVGRETIHIDARAQEATRYDTELALGTEPMRSVSHEDTEGRILRTAIPMFGQQLLLERMARPPATDAPAPAGVELYDYALIASPRPLTAEERRGTLRYALAWSGDSLLRGVASDEQDWQPESDTRATLTVTPLPSARRADPPTARDREATVWLDADDPGIRRFAKRATRGAGDDRSRMRMLEAAVARHIRDKSMRVGYASASQALAAREGDCTEHALLLAAAGRALGIATRVASGVAYVERFGERSDVFVPHAWAQAWVDGHWRSYDAALGGFGADHIAFAVGHGDPADHFAAVAWIGALRITAIEAITP
ncbi:MAG: transglutaminase domain-containing protein [Xanthomonadales bacterium]|nr:transglutaminase domain-containing protein [Xanthomonadales bacterium]